jgi:hypothetical protein
MDYLTLPGYLTLPSNHHSGADGSDNSASSRVSRRATASQGEALTGGFSVINTGP